MDQRFNYSRRVVDHRVTYDLNYSINKPSFAQGWKEAYKQRLLGNLMKSYGLYACFTALTTALIVSYADALWRENKPLSHQSTGFTSSGNRTFHFMKNHKNRLSDLGNWNHNFACFEKDPNCARDFDWVDIKKPQ